MKRIIVLLLTLVMVLSMAACSASTTNSSASSQTTKASESTATNQTTAATTSEDEKEPLHIVYVSPLLSHPIWLVAKDGFDQACKELGVQGDWVGPQGISPEEMAALVDTAVAQKADGIITQGLVPAEPVNEAIKAGIPVIIVDSDISGATGKLAYLGKDPEKQAQLIYEAARKKIGDDQKMTVAIQVSALNYQIAVDQIEADKAAFSKHPGGFELVNISESKADKMTGTIEWENTLKTYPSINVCINHSAEAGASCFKAVDEAGLKEKVAIYAVDDMEETIDLIKKGSIEGTVVVSFWNYGYQAAYWLYQNITEARKPVSVNNDAGTFMVTNENVNSYSDALKVKVDLPAK